MTKTELTSLVNGYGVENVITIVFDNDKIINFLDDNRFTMDMIKTVGGVDVIELNHLKLRSKKGAYDIPVTTVHPIDMIQVIGFSPVDRRSDVDKQYFHNI